MNSESNNEAKNLGVPSAESQSTSKSNAARQRVPRNIAPVILTMLERIPDQSGKLYSDLQRLLRNARYKAPEQQWESWQDGMIVLNEHLSDPEALTDWQQEIINIWMDIPPTTVEQQGSTQP